MAKAKEAPKWKGQMEGSKRKRNHLELDLGRSHCREKWLDPVRGEHLDLVHGKHLDPVHGKHLARALVRSVVIGLAKGTLNLGSHLNLPVFLIVVVQSKGPIQDSQGIAK